jgi:hypothetical protein
MMSLLSACRSVADAFPGATPPTAGSTIPLVPESLALTADMGSRHDYMSTTKSLRTYRGIVWPDSGVRRLGGRGCGARLCRLSTERLVLALILGGVRHDGSRRRPGVTRTPGRHRARTGANWPDARKTGQDGRRRTRLDTPLANPVVPELTRTSILSNLLTEASWTSCQDRTKVLYFFL